MLQLKHIFCEENRNLESAFDHPFRISKDYKNSSLKFSSTKISHHNGLGLCSPCTRSLIAGS